MARFSTQIINFIEAVGVDEYLNVAIVPKSDSAGVPGDVLFFNYPKGPQRLFMVIEPIDREAATGNLLLIGFKVPDDREYTPESLVNLYKNRELPEEGFRTYIMGKIRGPLRRISKPLKEQ
jgi:hypothetical protein